MVVLLLEWPSLYKTPPNAPSCTTSFDSRFWKTLQCWCELCAFDASFIFYRLIHTGRLCYFGHSCCLWCVYIDRSNPIPLPILIRVQYESTVTSSESDPLSEAESGSVNALLMWKLPQNCTEFTCFQYRNRRHRHLVWTSLQPCPQREGVG